jgi:ketosteroid isomerase-like protein
MTDIPQLVRRCFDAYLTRDRAALEAVIGDPFSFTSPYDDHIDRKTYFERCWGNADRIKGLRIEKLFAEGDEAFALYEVEVVSGEKFRNTEFFRVKDGTLATVEVYFGEVPGHTPKR